jgi:acyl carrier protein
MTPEHVRATVLAILGKVVPGAEVEKLDGGNDLREELDMDSLDVLNFAAALGQRFGIPVPEADYLQLLTLDSCIAYVMAAEPKGGQAT